MFWVVYSLRKPGSDRPYIARSISECMEALFGKAQQQPNGKVVGLSTEHRSWQPGELYWLLLWVQEIVQ